MSLLRRALCACLGGQQEVDWLEDDEHYVDVYSFRRTERLKVHEARTEAELMSCVVREHGTRRVSCH